MRSEGLSLDGLLLEQDRVSHWPAVLLGDISADFLMKGQPVQVSRTNLRFCAHLSSDRKPAKFFLGIGEIQDDGLVAPRRLIASA